MFEEGEPSGRQGRTPAPQRGGKGPDEDEPSASPGRGRPMLRLITRSERRDTMRAQLADAILPRAIRSGLRDA